MDEASSGLVPPPLGADGHCTGFPDHLGNLDFLHCCVVHDDGGTDGAFFDCMRVEVSHDLGAAASGVVVAVIVLVMLVFQPAYNLAQKMGWMK